MNYLFIQKINQFINEVSQEQVDWVESNCLSEKDSKDESLGEIPEYLKKLWTLISIYRDDRSKWKQNKPSWYDFDFLHSMYFMEVRLHFPRADSVTKGWMAHAISRDKLTSIITEKFLDEFMLNFIPDEVKVKLKAKVDEIFIDLESAKNEKFIITLLETILENMETIFGKKKKNSIPIKPAFSPEEAAEMIRKWAEEEKKTFHKTFKRL